MVETGWCDFRSSEVLGGCRSGEGVSFSFGRLGESMPGRVAPRVEMWDHSAGMMLLETYARWTLSRLSSQYWRMR